MSQLSLNIEEESDIQVIASSAYNFRIELIKRIGKKDINEILNMEDSLSESFGLNSVFTEYNINKYFNEKTLPFLARYKNEIVGFIIGVPLENFQQESWAKYDVNLGKNNTMILKNHGLLTAGKTIGETFMLMYYLDRSCKVQIDLLNTNKDIIKPADNLLEFAAGQYNDPKYQIGKHEWPALKRMLDKNNSIYKN